MIDSNTDKNVKIDKNTWTELAKEKINRDVPRISDIIRENVLFAKKFNNELEFSNWFKKNFKKLGFKKIIEERRSTSPDFRMETVDGKEIEVELETLSSHFIDHGHDPTKIDLVICLIADKKLENVEVVEIPNFEFINNIKPKIVVSEEVKEALDQLGKKTDTYDDILRRLLKNAKKE